MVGPIDCTHIRIRCPAGNDGVFINRKGFPSINVQAVCNADLPFINDVARWPGSSHDSFIFNHSALKDLLANGNDLGFLIGDSGYPLRPYLLTPFRQPSNDTERGFTASIAVASQLSELSVPGSQRWCSPIRPQQGMRNHHGLLRAAQLRSGKSDTTSTGSRGCSERIGSLC